MKKKILLIILPIILVIAIATAIIVAVILNKHQEDESTGEKWGDTYYAYLKDAINEDDLNVAEVRYGIMLGMSDSKIQFCEIDEGQDPTMIMTYKKNENSYVNVYQIADNKKVNYIAYKQPTEVEYLYNIEKDEYSWYVHAIGTDSDSYSSLKNISDKLKENAEESSNSKSDYVAEMVADYTIKKEEATTTQETVDGSTITLDKFDEIFVRPEVEPNKQIDFNADMKDKELKKGIKSAVEDYKKDSKKITDIVKETVAKKVEEVRAKRESIAKAKTDVENKKIQEEYSKGLKVGSATLKYGIYTYSDDGAFSPGQTLRGEITLEPNGKFHVKSNFDEMSGQPASHDEDGTYKIELNQDDGYGGTTNYITFKGNGSYSMSFQVYQDNSFSDQWHFYKLTTETKPTLSANNSSSTQNNSNNSSSNSHLTAFEYDVNANNKIAEGSYYRDRGTGYQSVLEIKNSTNNSFDFSIDAIYTSVAGSPNIGNIEGTAKAIKDGRFVFSTKEDSQYGYEYNIFFKISGSGDSATIEIEDECYMNRSGLTEVNPVAGHNVTFEGSYVK